MKKACVFCNIIAGKKYQPMIYQDRLTAAFLDIRPASKKGGHTLVIPKKHYELITDIPDKEMQALALTVKKMSKALLRFGKGMNMIQNNKRVAGQWVKHAHFHLIPRFEDDGIVIEKWVKNAYADGDMEVVAGKIRKLLK